MAKKKYKSPNGRVYYRRYVPTFNPYNPSEQLVSELKEHHLPNSNYIKKTARGMSMNDMDLDTAYFIAYEARMGREEIRLLATLKYFILNAQEEILTKEEMKHELCLEDDSIMELVDFCKVHNQSVLLQGLT